MRFSGTACPVLISALAGCSVLYNPSDLPAPKIDAAPPPDMPTDSNPNEIFWEDIGARVLLEGQGTGGSRPAVVAIVGGNFGLDATVSIAPSVAVDPPLLIEVDNTRAVRSPSGRGIAVPVTLPVDPARGADGATDVLLTVTVTQMASGQPVTLVIPDQVVLRNLPELTAPITSVASPPILYSQVEVAAPIAFTPRKGAPAAVIRAVGSITLGEVKADASGDTPGPGGGVGGASQAPGGGVGGGLPATLLSTASGGGYGTAGGTGTTLGGAGVDGGVVSGDDLITSYASNTSGGGGGGGPGGGGGGTLEITAGGTLTVGKVSANGAAGTGVGGGGSGGAIVLRSGAAATLNGAILATGGGAGNGVSVGGLGRVRYDFPMQVGTPTITAVKRPGVSFDIAGDANPLITTARQPELRALSAAASTQFIVGALTSTNTTHSSTTVTFGSAAALVTPTLIDGFNRICVSPPQGNPTLVESSTCIDIALIP